ncbi:hypothetical protein M9Y10_025980 [Tritrichomonas musculus]|uniref:Protein kinase domain-containing protein n=1 Tax=Tritrichomonas musculus TaxID=1915356 RepID=A0ABR2H9E6_9EUKA
MIPYQTDPESIQRTKKRILLILDKYKASRRDSANKKKKKSKNKINDFVIVQPKMTREQNPEMAISSRRIKKDNNNFHQSSPPEKDILSAPTQQVLIKKTHLHKKIELHANDMLIFQGQRQSAQNIIFKPKNPKEKRQETIRAPREKYQNGLDQYDLMKKNDIQIIQEQNMQSLATYRKFHQKSKRNENILSNILQIEEMQEITNSPKTVKKGQIFFNSIALPDFSDGDDTELIEEKLPIFSNLPFEKPFISRSSFNFTKSTSKNNITIDVNHPIYTSSSCGVFISKDDSNPPFYYAIKSSSFVSRLKREFDIYELINRHPSIITCYDMWIDEEKAFLQLELSPKGSIRKNLFSFNNDQIWQIFSHIIFALKKLHSIGYIHLDVSPSNILQCRSPDDSFDVYKLSDFGMSIPIGSFEEDCEGAGPYLSPEALLFPDTEFEVGPQADIFSFGVVMMELVSKKLAPRNSVNYRALRNGSFDFSALQIPEEFSFIKNMMDPDPTKRPSTEQLLSMTPAKKEIDKLVLCEENIINQQQIITNQIHNQQQQENQNLQQTPMRQGSSQLLMKQSLSQPSMKQSSSQSSMKQGLSQSSMKQGLSQSSMKQNSSQSSMKQGLSQSSMKQGLSQSSMKQNSSQSSMKQGSSQSSMKQGLSQSSMKQNSSQSSMKQGLSQSSMKQNSSQSSMKQGSSQLLMKQSLSQPSMKQSSSQSSMKQNSSQSSMKQGLSQSSMKQSSSQSSMKQSSSQSSMNPNSSQSFIKLPPIPIKQYILQSPTRNVTLQSSTKQKLPRISMKQYLLQSPTRNNSLQPATKPNCNQLQRKLSFNDSSDEYLPGKNKNVSNTFSNSYE